MLPHQQAAVGELQRVFADFAVTADELPDGRVWASLHDANPGTGWNFATITLSVYLPVALTTEMYPFYADAGLARTDGRAFSAVTAVVAVHDGLSRAQLSLKKPYDAEIEGVGARFAAVMHWLRNPR